jgi:hypothetical protein
MPRKVDQAAVAAAGAAVALRGGIAGNSTTPRKRVSEAVVAAGAAAAAEAEASGAAAGAGAARGVNQ